MMRIVLIGLGAGAAAALLYGSVASGAPLSLLLAHLAPLPILIVALGWSHWAGLTAAVSAAAGLGAVVGFSSFFAFLISVGIPAWWLGYLALLARPAVNGAAGGLQWYPVGHLVLWAALIGTIMVVVSFTVTFGTDKDTFQAGLRRFAEEVIRLQTSRDPAAAARLETKELVEVLVAAAPRVAAVFATLLNCFNLWLAGRIVNVSGRLRRPWPDLSAMTLPPIAPVLLAASIAGLFLPDLAGILAAVLVTSLIVAYAILGFAVLHAITRGRASRGLTLTATYAAIIPLAGLPILAMSMLGLADSALNIRARVASRRAPPKLPT